MAKHRVRVHKWVDGVLNVMDHFFENLEYAIAFSNQVDGHSAKVYTPENEVVFQASKVASDDTYATYA